MRFTYLLWRPGALADILAILQHGQDLLNGSLLLLELLDLKTLATTTGKLLHGLERLLGELDILDAQLLADNVQISDGVDVALYVNNLGIVEAANHLEDGIDGTDMRQESVSESGTGGGTTGQTSNIVDCQVGWHARFGVVFLAEPVVSLIGHNDASLLGVDGGIWEVLPSISKSNVSGGRCGQTYGGVSERALGDSLEERGLSDVGKADLRFESTTLLFYHHRDSWLVVVVGRTYDAALQAVSRSTQEDLLLHNSLLWWHLTTFCVSSGLRCVNRAAKQVRMYDCSSCCRSSK